LEKNYRFENKVKHLKSIDQSSKGKGYDGKKIKKQVEKLQETLKRMGKQIQWNTKAQLYGLLSKRGHKLGVQKF